MRTAACPTFNPAPTPLRSLPVQWSNGAAEGASLRVLPRDSFTPSGEYDEEPCQMGQFLELAFGAPTSPQDEMREVGELAQQRGEGGFMTKAELQRISPRIFANVKNVAELPTKPASIVPKTICEAFEGSAQNLFYSNNPERLKAPNLRLSEATLPSGRSRIVSHHVNATKEPMQLSTVFRNSGARPVTLTFLREASKVDSEGRAALVGLENYQEFLRNKSPRSVEIPPGKSYTWKQGPTMNAGRVATSMANITTSGPLTATTMATSAGVVPDQAKLRSPGLEGAEKGREPLEYRGSGLYPNPDQHLEATIAMSKPQAYQMVMGPEGKESTFDGEYGQERRYTLRVGDDAKPGQRLAILAWAGGKDPVGVRPLSDPSKLLAISAKPEREEQVAVLFEGEVKPGQILHMAQMVEAGASTPLRFLIVPIPISEGAGASKKKGQS